MARGKPQEESFTPLLELYMAIFTKVIAEAEINTIIKGWVVEPTEKLATTWAQLKHL